MQSSARHTYRGANLTNFNGLSKWALSSCSAFSDNLIREGETSPDGCVCGLNTFINSVQETTDLHIKTAYTLGTITLNWERVSHIQSTQSFVVEDLHGVRQSGSIKTTPGSSTELLIGDQNGPVTVRISDVSAINLVNESLIRLLRAKTDLGTSYTSSNNLRQFTFSGELGYYTEMNSLRTYGNALLNRPTEVQTQRACLPLPSISVRSGEIGSSVHSSTFSGTTSSNLTFARRSQRWAAAT